MLKYRAVTQLLPILIFVFFCVTCAASGGGLDGPRGGLLSARDLKEGQILNDREPDRPYDSIQSSIDEAKIGDTIRMGPGRYTEAIKLKEGVSLIGAGRDLSEIISSKGEPTVIAKEVNNGKLEGFTLTYAGEDNQPVVWVVGSTMEITRCRIRGSSVSGIEIEGSSGGVISYNDIRDNKQAGIYVHTNSNPFLWRNRIFNNDLSGISIGETSSPELEGNQIWSNKQAGIYVWGSSSPKILKNAVWKNSPFGIMIMEGSSPALVLNRIKGNKEVGVRIEKGSNPVLEQNMISENGGAAVIVNESSAPQLIQNVLARNNLGIYIYGSSNPVIKMNIVWRCETHGLMVESNSNPQVVNNVFWECGQCGIYITDGSEPVIVNNIIGKNEWGVSNEGNGEFRPRMEKNDLWENAMDYELMEKPPTDMGVKPQFAGPDTGNFHLMPGSPLLKAGKDGLNIGAYPTSP